MAKDKILSKADIIAAPDIKKELVKVPEWGGSVYLRCMDGLERDQFEDFCVNKQGKGIAGVMVLLLSMTLADENGQKLFSEKDVELLNKKSGKVIMKLYIKAKSINALTNKDIADLAKN
jgi:hypothetical protein